MEDTLRAGDYVATFDISRVVLILVLMEDTLRGLTSLQSQVQPTGLNPCFNGRYSQSISWIYFRCIYRVLILVLMEDTLRGYD